MRKIIARLWETWRLAKDFHEHHAFLGWCILVVPTSIGGLWAWLLHFNGLAIAIICLAVAALVAILLLCTILIRNSLADVASVATTLQPDYLSDIDSELTLALWMGATKSAWAKWFQAQPGAVAGATEHEALGYVISVLASKVCAEAMNGELEIRGRPATQVAYTSIPKETWRLAAFAVDSDPRAIWKVKIIPRSDVDPGRIREALSYDSLLVDSRQFEALYPSKQNW